MIPVRQGDGVGLSAGGFSEVREGDGTVLWSQGGAIPDSVLNQAAGEYDPSEISASDGQTVSTYPDISGNFRDMSGGDATFVANGPNGEPVLEFNSQSFIYGDGGRPVKDPPFQVFLVAKTRTPDGATQTIHAREGSNSAISFNIADGNGQYDIQNTTAVAGGDSDAQYHVFTTTFRSDGTGSLRVDGSDVITGSPGNRAIRGWSFGGHHDNTAIVDGFGGYFLFFNTELSNEDRDAVEDWLIGKYDTPA